MTFAIITPALMIGAFLERMRFLAVIIFMWLVNCIFASYHWVWGGGILSKMGVMDFAEVWLFMQQQVWVH